MVYILNSAFSDLSDYYLEDAYFESFLYYLVFLTPNGLEDVIPKRFTFYTPAVFSSYMN